MSLDLERSHNTKFKGLGVSPGVAIGTALRLDERNGKLLQSELKDATQIKTEIRRLHRAIDTAREQLLAIKERIERELGAEHSYILDAHILMLEDCRLIEEIERIIRSERVNAEWAVKTVTDRLLAVYASIKDDYLRERGSDIEDVAGRLIRVLSGERTANLSNLKNDVIIIADEIPPSYAAELDFSRVLAFATDVGGWTSHTAIIARSLGIPAVVGLHDISARINTGDTVVIDGTEGIVILDPSRATVRQYRARRARQRRQLSEVLKSQLPAITTDGQSFTLRANIELPSEIEAIDRFGAEGIGLFRSEFLFLNSLPDLPQEEEQFAFYRRLAEVTGEDGACIRTFDLGGDKAGLTDFEDEKNPALGLRAIRLSLKMENIFRTQLRAILRASAYGRLRIMLPLISSIAELRAAKKIVEEVKDELRREGTAFDEKIPVGVMIEVPSAVLSADLLAREADFFSIGTNDLIQYTLAVDRTNEQVAHLFQPLHPAILASLRMIAESARKAAIPVEVCGEMAANPIHAIVLMGFGLTCLSMTPASIPLIKNVIRAVSLQEVSKLADEIVMRFATSQEIEEFLFRELPRRFPHFFSNWMR